MKPEMMLVAILLPVLGGAVVPLIPFKKRIHMEIYIESVVVLTTLIVAGLLVNRPSEPFPIVRFVNNLSLSLEIDGLSMVFAGLVAALWPLATLYSFEYMISNCVSLSLEIIKFFLSTPSAWNSSCASDNIFL